ncbi:uncharacterized protein LOC122502084 isoform X2 [Leptopilina heterotoma]|uniref:uncharacterized protein LOC122502084 isoform X2 n=1 Tax=Leptopilina heterotoma TaxID=63436 RepID=UPI001CA9DA6A|nr:uncharacterized protein LOC122502084 isoform X2 [Leptopilina heterotoma]
MDNALVVNNCLIKEELDLTLEEEEEEEEEEEGLEEEEEEDEDEEEGDTDFLVDNNCDQNENDVNNPEEPRVRRKIMKNFYDFVYGDPADRVLRLGCQVFKYCNFSCKHFTQEARKEIFQYFWGTLDIKEKMEFISSHICMIHQNQKRTRRNYFFRFNEKMNKVCYRTFIDTLDISRSWIMFSLKNLNRHVNDATSQSLSEGYVKTMAQDKRNKVHRVENVENKNTSQSKQDALDRVKIQQDLQTMSFKKRGKNKPLSKIPKEKEFETIILDNNESSPSENSETKTAEDNEGNSKEIKEEKEGSNSKEIKEEEKEDSNSKEIKEKESEDPNKLGDGSSSSIDFKKPCGTCAACVYPLEKRKLIAQTLWKKKSYNGRIQYLVKCIKITEFKAQAYTFEFFLKFNPPESESVCEHGFQNTLRICNDLLKDAMMRVMEGAKSVPQSQNKFTVNLQKKAESAYDKKLAYFWKKAKIFKIVCQTRTKLRIEQSNGMLFCNDECYLYCQMTKSQWFSISNEFWRIDSIAALRKFILNHIQFFSLSNKPCRKYFLKIDNILTEVCRYFFLETLSIRGELIEMIGMENNSEIRGSNETRGELPIAEKNYLTERKMSLPCDAFHHHRCRQISERQRRNLFRYFWMLKSDLARYSYIAKHVQVIEDHFLKGNCQLFYFLEINEERYKVCQIMFESTFDIDDKWIKRALNKLSLAPKEVEKKTINLTLKRSLSPDLILRNVKKIAYSQSTATKESEAHDPEIIDISNDSIEDSVEPEDDESVEANSIFDILQPMEIKKEDEERIETQTGELLPIKSELVKLEVNESSEFNLVENLNTEEEEEIEEAEVKEEVMSEDEIIEIDSKGEKVNKNEHKIDSEELAETLDSIDRLSDEEIIEINSEDEEEIGNKSSVKTQIYVNDRIKFPLSRKLKGKFCNNNCKNKCYFINDHKDHIFNYFWNIGSRYHKFEFLSRNVDVVPFMISKSVKNEVVTEVITMNLNFFLEVQENRIMVCQETFLAILGIKIEWIHNVLNYFGRNLENVTKNHTMCLNSLEGRDISKAKVDNGVAFEAGLPYVTTKGTTVPGRKVRKGCNDCDYECKSITHRQREEIFHDFWNISNRRRKYDYLWEHIKKIRFEDWSNIYNVKEFYFDVDGKSKEVCPITFTATLDIDVVWVEKLEQLRNSVSY